MCLSLTALMCKRYEAVKVRPPASKGLWFKEAQKVDSRPKPHIGELGTKTKDQTQCCTSASVFIKSPCTSH